MKHSIASLLVATSLIPTAAVACVCSPGETGSASPKTAVAFVGRPIKIEVVRAVPEEKTFWQKLRDLLDPPASSSPYEKYGFRLPVFLGSVRVTFEVSEYLKGSGPKQMVVLTGYGESDCGLPISIAKRYAIYTRQIDGALRTSYCFGSAEYKRQPAALQCRGS